MTIDPTLAAVRTCLDRGQFGEAVSRLQPLIGEGTEAPVLTLLAEALAGLGLSGDAADILEKLAADDGAERYGHLRRAARLHLAAGNSDQAQLLALRLLQERPDDPELSFILVRIFQQSGETSLVDALKNRLVTSEEPEHLQLALELIGHEHLNPARGPLYRKLRALFPDDPYIRFTNLDVARGLCDFETVAREEAAIRAELDSGRTDLLAAETPHSAIMWLEDEALLRRATNIGGLTPFTRESQALRHAMPHAWARRLRIGYVSGDFWDDHATMRLLGEVLSQHDRDRFEITLFCNTPERFAAFDQGGRQRWGRIVSIRGMDDAEAEAAIRAAGIDILVDLKGHTGDNRCGIFNRAAAPVQVAWLGFPGTVAGVDCDYVIGDRFVLPAASQVHYHERFCRMPESYQPNDPVHHVLPPATPRAALGLPEDRFLFASFNAPRKLSLEALDLWAAVLRASPGADLWIMGPEAPIRAAFSGRGIDPVRLHMAGKCAYPDHIARAQAADLALDSFPCNGHTTTSDMLWAGVPVVTMRGQAFAGRVSESLLHAVGLPELVAGSAEGFVALAAGLAADRARMAEFTSRLAANRFRAPLFDAERFCRHLETAYEAMAARARAGLPPEGFDVPPLPARDGPFKT